LLEQSVRSNNEKKKVGKLKQQNNTMEKTMITQNSWTIALLLLPVLTQILLPLVMLVIWLSVRPLQMVIVTETDPGKDAKNKQFNDDTVNSLATSSV